MTKLNLLFDLGAMQRMVHQRRASSEPDTPVCGPLRRQKSYRNKVDEGHRFQNSTPNDLFQFVGNRAQRTLDDIFLVELIFAIMNQM